MNRRAIRHPELLVGSNQQITDRRIRYNAFRQHERLLTFGDSPLRIALLDQKACKLEMRIARIR